MDILLIAPSARRRELLRERLLGAGLVPAAEAAIPSDADDVSATVGLPAAAIAMPRTVDDDDFGEASLTDREQDVLDLLAEGLSNQRIADRLGISPHTVKFHIASIYDKLDARTRTQAVRHALDRGLLHL